MSHSLEAIIGIAGLIAYFIYYQFNAKIDLKIIKAERILFNNERLDSDRVGRTFREERVAIRAIAKQKNTSPEQLAYWIKTRLL